MKKRRILFYLPEGFIGGAETHAIGLACGLSPDRFDCRVVSRLLEPAYHELKSNTARRIPWLEVADESALEEAVRVITPDVILSFHQDSIQRIIEKLRLTSRLIEISHCSHSWARDITKTSKSRVDAIVSVSETAYRFASAGLPDWSGRHQLIWNGVRDPIGNQEMERTRGSERVEILTVGRMDLEGKKLIELIDGVRRAGLRSGRCWGLTLLGDGPDLEILRSYSDALAPSEIRLPGFVSDPLEWYLRSDLYVSRSEFEGFGLSIAEAGMAGLPVVMWDCGGISSTMAGNQGVELVASQDGFEDALFRLIMDDGLRSRMGRENRGQITSLFSMEAMVASYETLIESLC